MQLLLQIAEMEPEGKLGQAQKVFYLFYSVTSAKPKTKFQIIGYIRNSESIKKQEIALKTLSAVFEREGDETFLRFYDKIKDGRVIHDCCLIFFYKFIKIRNEMSFKEKTLNNKNYIQIKSIEKLYKTIHKYSLRREAYKKLLELTIKIKKKS